MLTQNAQRLNRSAWRWLREAKVPPDPYSLHLLELARWGLDNQVNGGWPARDRPEVESQVDALFGWKPENALHWLLSNPNGPDDQAEQERSLLVALQKVSSPERAAGVVLEAIYSRLQSVEPALQPAASELS